MSGKNVDFGDKKITKIKKVIKIDNIDVNKI